MQVTRCTRLCQVGLLSFLMVLLVAGGTYAQYTQAQPINLDRPVQGRLSPERPQQWYAITTHQPGTLPVQAEAQSDLNFHLQLFDSNGTSNLHNNASGVEAKRTVEHTHLNPGTYYVNVRRASGDGTFSMFASLDVHSLSGDKTPDNARDQSYPLSLNAPATGLLGYFSGGRTDGMAWFQVQIEEPGHLQVRVQGEDTLSIHTQLFDINGTSNLHNDASGSSSNRLVERDNLDPGTYFIQVRRSSGYGRYTITTLEPSEAVGLAVPPAVTPPAPPSPPVTPGPSAIPDTGTALESFISITHHHFDVTPVGHTSRTTPLEFRNSNQQPITIWELRWRGPDAEHFLIQQPTQFDRLLQPSQALVIEIVFAPKSSGMKWALLEIHTDAGTWHVPFQGIGP